MALFGRKKTAAPAAPEESTATAQPPVVAPPQVRTIEAHRAALLARVEPLPPFGMGVLDALGLPLCETIVADIDLPTFAGSLHDGYAVRAADLAGAGVRRPVHLPVLDTLDSPRYRGAPLLEGTAVRVAVGAPIPEGADSVVPLAHTDGGEDTVAVVAEVARGAGVRPAGAHIAAGTMLLRQGQTLDAGAIGLLAEVGVDKVLVRARPRVVVLTVGSDLVPPGLPLTSRAQRYDATTSLIAAAARADGAQVFPVGTFAENADELRQVLSDQLIRADLLVVVGDAATVAEVLPSLGESDFCEVAMHPGGNQGFAAIGEAGTPVIVLPGGVASAFVGYRCFVQPALRRLQGLAEVAPRTAVRPARVAVQGSLGRTELIPARLTGRGVEPVGDPASVTAHDVARADALIVLPAGTERVGANADVEVWLLAETRR